MSTFRIPNFNEFFLQIYSRFPKEIPIDELLVSLTFSEPATSAIQDETGEKRSLVTKNKRPMRHTKASRYVETYAKKERPFASDDFIIHNF